MQNKLSDKHCLRLSLTGEYISLKYIMSNRLRSHSAIFILTALIALQSLMPLAGELLVRNGVISISSMQVVCSQAGVKYVSTADLNDSRTQHSVKCPWCQLSDPAVLPSVTVTALYVQQYVSAWLPQKIVALARAAWLLAPARAPPNLQVYFA
jgi:hypothetical protein